MIHIVFLEENLEKAVRKFYSLLDDEHFPKCDTFEFSEKDHPGEGFNDENIESLIKFTKEFPSYVFKIWLSCFNCTEMHVIEVKGDQVLSKNIFRNTALSVTEDLNIYYDFKDPSIKNDISMDIFHCSLSNFKK